MSEQPTYPFTVWLRGLVDKPCHTEVEAKKHAAWLAYITGSSDNVKVTERDKGNIDFSNYEFSNGDSRKV